MAFKPVNRCIYVVPDRPIEKQGSIIIPPSDKKQTRGLVKASNSSFAKVGDRVLYNRIAALIDGLGAEEDWVVVYERDIIGVENGNATPFQIPPADNMRFVVNVPGTSVLSYEGAITAEMQAIIDSDRAEIVAP